MLRVVREGDPQGDQWLLAPDLSVPTVDLVERLAAREMLKAAAIAPHLGREHALQRVADLNALACSQELVYGREAQARRHADLWLTASAMRCDEYGDPRPSHMAPPREGDLEAAALRRRRGEG